MKSADRATSNGNEAKGKDLSGEDRAGAVDEASERWHQDLRPDNEDAGGKRENSSGFDERAEIVTRRQQQPDRQSRRREAVCNDGEGERHTAQGEHAGPGR